jgi:hypothetical protein
MTREARFKRYKIRLAPWWEFSRIEAGSALIPVAEASRERSGLVVEQG